MKNTLKFGLLAFCISLSMTACKGGFSGKKMDSTMVNKEAMDSTAARNEAAQQTDSAAAKADSGKKDTTKKM